MAGYYCLSELAEESKYFLKSVVLTQNAFIIFANVPMTNVFVFFYCILFRLVNIKPLYLNDS